MESRNKRSDVWNYFTIKDDNTAKCNICKKSYSFKSNSTSNLKKHLNTLHYCVVSKETAAKELVTSESMPETSKLSLPNSRPQANVAKCSKQSALPSFFMKPCSSERIKRLNKKALMLVAKDLQPLSIVNDEGFREFVNELDPSYKLPSSKCLGLLMPQTITDLEEKIGNELKNQIFLSLSMDYWTSRTQDSYCAITAHFVDIDFNLKTVLLGCPNVNESHTKENIKSHINSICGKWGVQEKVVSVTTDNAANITAGINLTDYSRLPCLAHTLNTMVQKSLKTIEGLKQKVKSIVEYFHKSSQAANKLKEMQKSLMKPSLKLINDVPTRWNSTYNMLERLCEVREPLEATMGILHVPFGTLSEREWILINEVKTILKPFLQATEELSTEKNVSASKIIPMARGLAKAVINASNGALSNEAKTLATSLIENLKLKFHQVEQRNILAQATFLDPRFKNKAFAIGDSLFQIKHKIERETEKLIIQMNSYEQNETEHAASSLVTDDNDLIWGDFDSNNQVGQSTALAKAKREIELYSLEQQIARKDNPLHFWKERTMLYPHLSLLARKYLAVMATSVPSERIFSKTGQIVSERRNRLKPKNVEYLIFLNANKNYM